MKTLVKYAASAAILAVVGLSGINTAFAQSAAGGNQSGAGNGGESAIAGPAAFVRANPNDNTRRKRPLPNTCQCKQNSQGNTICKTRVNVDGQLLFRICDPD